MEVGVDRIESLLLQLVCRGFGHESDSAPFLVEVYQHTLALLFDHLQCLMELLSTFAAHGAENVASCTGGVYADQNRFVLLPFSLDNCHMVQSVRLLPERHHMEIAIEGGQ